MSKFDVVRDKWIPVLNKKGEIEEVSIRDIFLKGHTYKEILDSNIFYEYGMKRLIVEFAMDCYNIKKISDKETLLQKGYFDIEVFDNYINECEKRGNCFDLFDEKVPFLQAPYAKVLNKNKSKGLGKIVLELPSGNNCIHFCNDNMIGQSIDYRECVKALCSYNLFQPTNDAANSGNDFNGALHPYYFWIQGNTVFEEVLLNSITESTVKSGYYDGYRGGIAWQLEDTKKNEEIEIASLLQGMTFQNRRVLLIPNENEDIVSDIYFAPYSKVVRVKENAGFNVWREPHAAYKIVEKKNKKGKVTSSVLKPVCLTENKFTWLDIGKMFESDSVLNPLTIQEYFNIYEKAPNFSVLVYSVCLSDYTGQGPIKMYGKDKLNIPYEILKSDFKRSMLSENINLVELVGNSILSSMRARKVNNFTENNFDLRRYYEKIHNYLFSNFIPAIEHLDEEDLSLYNTIVSDWKKKLKSTAIETYKDEFKRRKFKKTIKSVNLKDGVFNSHELYALEYNIMVGRINKILNNKGGEVNGNN